MRAAGSRCAWLRLHLRLQAGPVPPAPWNYGAPHASGLWLRASRASDLLTHYCSLSQRPVSSARTDPASSAAFAVHPVDHGSQLAPDGASHAPAEAGAMTEGTALPLLESPPTQKTRLEKGQAQRTVRAEGKGFMPMIIPSPVAHIGTSHAHRLCYSNSPVQQQASPLSRLRPSHTVDIVSWQDPESPSGRGQRVPASRRSRPARLRVPTAVAANALGAAPAAQVPTLEAPLWKNTSAQDAQYTSNGALFAYEYTSNGVVHLDQRLQGLPSVKDVRYRFWPLRAHGRLFAYPPHRSVVSELHRPSSEWGPAGPHNKGQVRDIPPPPLRSRATDSSHQFATVSERLNRQRDLHAHAREEAGEKRRHLAVLQRERVALARERPLHLLRPRSFYEATFATSPDLSPPKGCGRTEA